jgi:hypothetical protein
VDLEGARFEATEDEERRWRRDAARWRAPRCDEAWEKFQVGRCRMEQGQIATAIGVLLSIFGGPLAVHSYVSGSLEGAIPSSALAAAGGITLAIGIGNLASGDIRTKIQRKRIRKYCD